MKLTVRQARIGKLMSQEEAAKALEICVNSYRKYEHDPKEMSIEMAYKVARVFGREFEEIDFLMAENSN